MLKKNKICILMLTLSFGCANLPAQEQEYSEPCTVNMKNYEFTEFDCGDEYKQYIVCGDPIEHCGEVDWTLYNRPGCTTSNLIDEFTMGHCHAHNYCKSL